MSEREIMTEDKFQKRDQVGHGPGPDLDLNRGNVNMDSLLQKTGPDPGKGGEIIHDYNNSTSPPETRRSHDQKTRGNTDPDRAQGRGGKTKDHPGVHRKLQDPVLRPQKTQNTHRTRKKRRIPLEVA